MPKREVLGAVQRALWAFSSGTLADSTKGLLNALEYDSDKTFELSPNTYAGFYEAFARNTDGFNAENARAAEWTSADVIFQVADEDLNRGQNPMFSARELQRDRFNSFVFMAIGLQGNTYTRTALAAITREVNKCLTMPVIVLFRHGDALTLAVISRRQNLREGNKDVLAKVTLIKDVSVSRPHRAHLEVLADLSLASLADRKKHRISSFESLFGVWQEVLDTTELNRRFYRELSNWFFWALRHARFPELPAEDKNRTEVALIRLITRLIFVWFLKEKDLVPDALFDRDKLDALLAPAHRIDTNGSGSGYYRAVLQNLFFATLNTEMNSSAPDSRGFKTASAKGQGYNREYMTHTRYRYQSYFRDPDAALRLFENVPFLNGGLFECLDRAAAESPSGKEERIDGFSDDPRKHAELPDRLFFGEENVDLNSVYGTKNKRPEHVRGLLDIFNSYKFTVDENTPVEEEVALDPELLGKVFENLLASYNPETETTARKQTGSFYTPREIVNYMVDESLVATFTSKLTESGMPAETAQAKLRELFAYLETPHTFSEDEVTTLVAAIDAVKILDPACGSGAFPMGVLLRLVEILGQLDPDNRRWQAQQLERLIAPVVADKQQAQKIGYDKARESALAELEERLADIRRAFAENNHNYARKLFLIENCIYGVDIQPIAVQIAKLRFFITLVVDQRVDDAKKNRGIITLPNLETKFVAANTLLGIAKPAQGMFEDPELIEKQDDLKALRHEHFQTRSYEHKKSLREKDKKLRHEIAGLLKRNYFKSNDGTAEKLANWNPYDQNAQAEFFDSVWMFDVDNGFDIVVGNPPYISALEAKRLIDPSIRAVYKASYEAAHGAYDIYVLFFEKGLSFTKRNGLLTFITPSKYLSASYAESLRKLILNYGLLGFVDYSRSQVFESAGVSTLITMIKNGVVKDDVMAVSYYTGQKKTFYNRRELLTFLPEFLWGFLLSENISILQKIIGQSKRLEQVAQVNASSTAAEAEEYMSYVSNFEGTDKLKIINTGTIDPFVSLWGYKPMRAAGEALPTPYIDTTKISGRRLSMYKEPKLIFAKLGKRPEVCLDGNGEYASVNTNFVFDVSKNLGLAFLAAYFNSRLFHFIYSELFGGLSMLGSFQYQAPQLRIVPVPDVQSDETRECIAEVTQIVKQILLIKHTKIDADIKLLQVQIDRLIYRLYRLTEEEVANVESIDEAVSEQSLS